MEENKLKLKYLSWVGQFYPEYSIKLTNSDIEKFCI